MKYFTVLVAYVVVMAAGAKAFQKHIRAHAAAAVSFQGNAGPAPAGVPATAAKPAAVNPHLPNMVKICGDGCTIGSVSNQDAVLQYGTGSTWTPALRWLRDIDVPARLPTKNLAAIDPAPGIAKEMDAERTSSPYTVTFVPADGAGAKSITIPAMCGANPTPVANPELPVKPTICPQLPGETAVCADGCTLSDVNVSGPLLLQYCASATKCTPAFLFLELPLPVKPGTAKLGGNPDATASARTLYAVSTGPNPSTVTWIDAAKASHTVIVPPAPAALQASK